jgi:hypothetical protein
MIEVGRGQQSASTVSDGAWSPPIASSAIRSKSGFPGGCSLLSSVKSAFEAQVVRALWTLASRALLESCDRRLFVRVARAFLSL